MSQNPQLDRRKLLAWCKTAKTIVNQHGYRSSGGKKGLSAYIALSLAASGKTSLARAFSELKDFDAANVRSVLRSDREHQKLADDGTTVDIWCSDVLGRGLTSSPKVLDELIRELSK